MKKCVNCGVELDDNAIFCEECGIKQTEQKRFCENCGAELQAGEAFCPECGTPAGNGVASAVQTQTPAVELPATSEDIALMQPDGNTICISVKGIPFNMRLVEGCEYGTKSEITDFYIGETPVTQALWLTLMGENPSRDNANLLYPVTNIDQSRATTLLVKLQKLTGVKFELPTKVQWDFAYKGGNRSKGCKYAGSNNVAEVGWVNDDKLHPVGELFANELGLCDMEGNVDELLNDSTWAPRVSGKKASANSNLAGVRLVVNIPVAESVGTTTPLQTIIAEYQSKLKATRDAAIQELKVKEEEEARIKAEKDAARKAEEEAAQLKAEEQARIKAAEDAKRKAEAEAKRAVEREVARKKAEENARIKAERESAERAELAVVEQDYKAAKKLLAAKEQQIQSLTKTIQDTENTISDVEKDTDLFNHRHSVVLLRRVDYSLFNSKGANFDKVLTDLTGAEKEQIKDWNQKLKSYRQAVIGENLEHSVALKWKNTIDTAGGEAKVQSPYSEVEESEIINRHKESLASAKTTLQTAQNSVSQVQNDIETANEAYQKLRTRRLELKYRDKGLIRYADDESFSEEDLMIVFGDGYKNYKDEEQRLLRMADEMLKSSKVKWKIYGEGSSDNGYKKTIQYVITDDGKTLILKGSGNMSGGIYNISYSDCEWIENVVITGDIKSIGDNCFSGFYSRLTTVIITDSIEYIGKEAFTPGGLSSSHIKYIKFPKNLKTIKEKAFLKCRSLECLYLPKGVETIEEFGFGECENLRTALVPESAELEGGVGKVFLNCNKINNRK